ncbi:hypothetical protein G9A89_014410 [Geosiphon pyriformis]|nr:hypothetical protein G9A89_014410 [Geosiphon pyriformis]
MSEAKRVGESRIRSAIDKRMESFELNKSHTIRSMLKHPFHKVTLDHLVMDNELVLESDLVRTKVDKIIEGWTRKCNVVPVVSNVWYCQYQPLKYVFDGTFSDVMCSIDFDKMSEVISNLPNKKVAGLSGISNKLWKHCDKVMTNFGLTNEYMVHDSLDQGKVFSPLLWHIFYDPLLCKIKRQKSVCEYKLDSHFINRIGRSESQAGLTFFLAADAFVDDIIWVDSSQTAMQHIFNIASKFFQINDILINNDKTIKVKNHSGVLGNEHADTLTSAAAVSSMHLSHIINDVTDDYFWCWIK